MLVHMPEAPRYEILGQPLDDAAGEAFDKIARFLGLGFPGGPALDRLARDGNPAAIAFPRSMADSGDYDFSLSGLKTAVLRHVRGERDAGHEVDPADLAASFQEAIVDVQVRKTLAAARDRGVERVSNRALQQLMAHDWPGNVRELGNVLERDGELLLVDFDDCRIGPAVQDLWLALPGDDRESEALRAELLAEIGRAHV